MSDLRVWVDGVERVVRGVNEDTTCESVLLALANATGKLGKLALLEKWRDLEKILPREAKPVQCLQMWGKLAKEVHFVLKLMKDNLVHNEGIGGRAESEKNGEGRCACDPLKQSFEQNILGRTIENQSNKLARLTRDLEMLQLESDCYVEDDESYLYFTEEEITEDRILKLGQVSKLQSKELVVERTYINELSKERSLQEKLRLEIQSQRNKLRLLDVHISDLENVGSKIYAMLVPHDSETDNGPSTAAAAGAFDLEEIQHEITVTREELSKQRDLFERQSEEVETIKKSFAELQNLASQKSDRLCALKDDSSCLHEKPAYYDLDKNLQLDNEEDKWTNYVDSRFLQSNKDKLMSASAFKPSHGHKTIAPFSPPSPERKPSVREHFLANGISDLDDQGVFV